MYIKTIAISDKVNLKRFFFFFIFEKTIYCRKLLTQGSCTATAMHSYTATAAPS